MADILVVYHDKIPKYRSKFLQGGIGSDTATLSRGDDTYTGVTLENWFNPISFRRNIRTLADFADNDLVVDASKFTKLNPTNYDAYIFVSPLAHSGYKATDAAWLFNFCQEYNSDAVYAVVDFALYGMEFVPYNDILAHGTSVASVVSNDSVVPMAQVQNEYERYLGYRISNDLSEKFKSRIGLSVNQYRIISDMLLSNVEDDLNLKLTYEMDDGATVDLTAKMGITVQGEKLGPTDRFDNLVQVAKHYTSLASYDQALKSEHTTHELMPNALLSRWFPTHKNMMYERCVQLAATGLITNPFDSLTSELVRDKCVEASKLYPKSKLISNGVFGVWADVSSGASPLIEYNDQLVDMFVDIHDHTVASMFKLGSDVDYLSICEALTDIPVTISGNIFTKKALSDTHLLYQSVIPVSYFRGSTTQIAFRCRPYVASSENFHFWSHLVAPNDVLRELSRLLSKRYLALSPGGTLHLTDFGAVVFAITESMYKHAIPTKRENDYVSLKTANDILKSMISETSKHKVDKKLLNATCNIKGKEREFELVLKNSRAGKQVFWKSKTIVRGVRPMLKRGRIKIKVLRNKSKDYQIKKRLDALVACSCGEFHSLWVFDPKTKKSSYKCVNCGCRRDHYVIFQ